MLGLLVFFLLLTVGIFLAYRFSSASKVKERMQEALSSFEELDAELHRLRQSVQNDIELSSSQYIQGVHAARFKAIPLDELKKHATGMRLQALRDVGVWSVADLQGWNEYRVSQVRGVGPKSASSIVQAVSKITAATKAVPISHPAPPFSSDTERQLMQALYRQHCFDMDLTEQSDAFAKVLTLHRNTRDEIVRKMAFSRWLWKLGSNETIRQNLDQATAMFQALEGQGSLTMRDKLSTSLSHCRAICANRVPVESVIQNFNENRELYDSWLTSRLGNAGSKALANPMSQQTAPKTSAVSDLVLVEFGPVVSEPSPPPIGETRTGFASAETPKRPAEQLISSVLV
jgi:hypothetical protein